MNKENYSSDIFALQEIKFEHLLNYISTVTVNDEYQLELDETSESSQRWKKLEIDFYQNTNERSSILDRIDEYISLERDMYLRYEESNRYVNKIVEKSLLNTGKISQNINFLHVRLLNNFTILSWNSRYELTGKLKEIFEANLTTEVEYVKTLFHVEYYAKSELYINLSTYFILVSTAMRTMVEYSSSDIVLSTTENYLLNNFLASHGFFLFNEVPLTNKSEFALNLIKLYQTKGTKENIKLLNEIFSNGQLEPYYLYLYFDKPRWINEGSPLSKVGYYQFLKVKMFDETETFQTVYNTLEENNSDRMIGYSQIVQQDNSWQVDEEELFEREIFLVKTKYCYLEGQVDLESYNLEYSSLMELLDFAHDRIGLNNLNSSIKDLVLSTDFLNYATNKRVDLDTDFSYLRKRNQRNVPILNVNQTFKNSFIINPTVSNLNEIISQNRQNYQSNIKNLKNSFAYSDLKLARSKFKTDHFNNSTNFTSDIITSSLEEYLEQENSILFNLIKNDEKFSVVANDNFVSATENTSFELRLKGILLDTDPKSNLGMNVTELFQYFLPYYSKISGGSLSHVFNELYYSLRLSDINDKVRGNKIYLDTFKHRPFPYKYGFETKYPYLSSNGYQFNYLSATHFQKLFVDISIISLIKNVHELNGISLKDRLIVNLIKKAYEELISENHEKTFGIKNHEEFYEQRWSYKEFNQSYYSYEQDVNFVKFLSSSAVKKSMMVDSMLFSFIKNSQDLIKIIDSLITKSAIKLDREFSSILLDGRNSTGVTTIEEFYEKRWSYKEFNQSYYKYEQDGVNFVKFLNTVFKSILLDKGLFNSSKITQDKFEYLDSISKSINNVVKRDFSSRLLDGRNSNGITTIEEYINKRHFYQDDSNGFIDMYVDENSLSTTTYQDDNDDIYPSGLSKAYRKQILYDKFSITKT